MPRILVDDVVFYLSTSQFAKLNIEHEDAVRDMSEPSTYRVYRDPDAFKAVISAARGYNINAVTEHMHRDIQDFYPDYLTTNGLKTYNADNDTQSIDSVDYFMGMDNMRAMMEGALFHHSQAPPPPSSELDAKVQELEETGVTEELGDKGFNDISTDPSIIGRISQFIHEKQKAESDIESLGFDDDDDDDDMSDIEKEVDQDYEMYKELLRSEPIQTPSQGSHRGFKPRITPV